MNNQIQKPTTGRLLQDQVAHPNIHRHKIAIANRGNFITNGQWPSDPANEEYDRCNYKLELLLALLGNDIHAHYEEVNQQITEALAPLKAQH